YLPDIKAGNFQMRQAAERTAINAPMQGSAADIIKLAMRSVQAWLEESSLATRMIMQVHDELVFEVPEEELETAVAHIQSLMSSAAQLLIPLEVEVGQGVNWEEAH
ncbi:MAG: DNA polymerase, partial [Pseudomonadales bacterium]